MNQYVCRVASIHTLVLTTNMALMLLNYTPLLTVLGSIRRYESNKEASSSAAVQRGTQFWTHFSLYSLYQMKARFRIFHSWSPILTRSTVCHVAKRSVTAGIVRISEQTAKNFLCCIYLFVTKRVCFLRIRDWIFRRVRKVSESDY